MEIIEYPAGEDPLQLWRIPHGIANKLSPVPTPDADTQPLLIDVRKRVPAAEMDMLEELTDADLALLRRIWNVPEGSPLPIEAPCRQSDFAELRRRFDAAPQRPAWSLFAQFSDWAQEQRNKNADLQRKHWALIGEAIRAGRLHPLTRDRLPAASVSEAALLGASEARAYLRPLGFELVEVIPDEARRAVLDEFPAENLAAAEASGQLHQWLQQVQSARTLSDTLHRDVSAGDVKVRQFESAAEMLHALLQEGRQPRKASIQAWATWFAIEAAAAQERRHADPLQVRQYEQALTKAARKGELRVRTLDAVHAPIEVRPDMPEDELATRLSVTAEDLRAWATRHWPELSSSMLLGEPVEAPSAATWDDLAEIRIPGGMRLISQQRALGVLLDATIGPLPEATMDGEIRKSVLPPFASMTASAPTEDLTHAERAWLEATWNAAGLSWPEHPTASEWTSRYLPAFRDADNRPRWTPVSTWGRNRKIAERNRELTSRRYEAEVFADMPSYGATGLPAPPEFGLYWNVEDVKARLSSMGAQRPAPTTWAPQQQPAAPEALTLKQQWANARGDRKARHALAVATLRACQDNKAKAARRLGLSGTKQLYDALNWSATDAQQGVAGVAGVYAQLTAKPRKD